MTESAARLTGMSRIEETPVEWKRARRSQASLCLIASKYSGIVELAGTVLPFLGFCVVIDHTMTIIIIAIQELQWQ